MNELDASNTDALDQAEEGEAGALTESRLGEMAANLKWADGESWGDIYDCFPDHKPETVRSAARRYKAANEWKYSATPGESNGRTTLGQKFEEDGNEALATSTSEEITTQAQLIEKLGIDMKVWYLVDFSASSSTAWRGNVKKDLTFNNGRLTGTVKDGGIITRPLVSLRAKFARIDPKPLTVSISPLRVPEGYLSDLPGRADKQITLTARDKVKILLENDKAFNYVITLIAESYYGETEDISLVHDVLRDEKETILFDPTTTARLIANAGVDLVKVLSELIEVIEKYLSESKHFAGAISDREGVVVKERVAGDKIVKTVYVADLHIGFNKRNSDGKLTPFHDREALSVILQVVRDVQPDEIVILGDLFDFAVWSKRWTAKPEFFWTTQPALVEAFWFLSQLRKLAPDSKIVIVEGNHDARVEQLALASMQEAVGLKAINAKYPVFDLNYLLDLPSLDIEFIGGYYDKAATYCPVDWVKNTHGHKAKAVGTSVEMLKKENRWVFYGHTHRYELVKVRLKDGTIVTAACFGCCCHTDGRLPGSGPEDNWHKGFGLFEYQRGHKDGAITSISLEEGGTIFRGKKYMPFDYLDDLRKITREVYSKDVGFNW